LAPGAVLSAISEVQPLDEPVRAAAAAVSWKFALWCSLPRQPLTWRIPGGDSGLSPARSAHLSCLMMSHHSIRTGRIFFGPAHLDVPVCEFAKWALAAARDWGVVRHPGLLDRQARYAMRCIAMRCDAMRCDATRCDAMRCYAMLDRQARLSARPNQACTMPPRPFWLTAAHPRSRRACPPSASASRASSIGCWTRSSMCGTLPAHPWLLPAGTRPVGRRVRDVTTTASVHHRCPRAETHRIQQSGARRAGHGRQHC
jgi:hypothetical protein